MQPGRIRQQIALARAMAALAPLFLVTGCSGLRDLNATDGSAITYSARGVVRLGSNGGPGIEMDYANVRGRDDEFIGAAETVQLGGQSIAGPVTLRHTARAQSGHIAFNYLHFPNRPVELEWLVGLGGASLDWSSQAVSGAPPRLSRRVEWLGVTAGVGARWNIAPWVALEGRVSVNYAPVGLFGSDTYGERTLGEIAFAFRPVRQLALRAGYAQSTTFADHSEIESRLNFKARGPFLGLGLVF